VSYDYSTGIDDLADGLRINNSLNALVLSNKTHQLTMGGLGEALKYNQSLISLMLWCQIDDEGVRQLSEALHHNHSLKVLDLSGN